MTQADPDLHIRMFGHLDFISFKMARVRTEQKGGKGGRVPPLLDLEIASALANDIPTTAWQ